MKFSQRKGYKKVSEVIQKETISESLRNSLWNIMDLKIWTPKNFRSSLYFTDNRYVTLFSRVFWLNYLKMPMDTIPDSCWEVYHQIRKVYFKSEWYEVYDFVEFVLRFIADEEVNESVNNVLARELSAYRYVGGVFTNITDEQEISMLEEALADDDFPGVRTHLQTALEMLSRKDDPDYRNSIKESISAVESLSREITGKSKATLGDALKELEKSGKLHPALKEGFLKLYGYTSDEDGIRHAMMEEPDLGVADAKYFLLSCTSFINYLKSKVEIKKDE